MRALVAWREGLFLTEGKIGVLSVSSLSLIVCYCVLQCIAVCYNKLQCVAVCCSLVQCVAVCCNVVAGCRHVLQCVAVCCSVLQWWALQSSVLVRVKSSQRVTNRIEACASLV